MLFDTVQPCFFFCRCLCLVSVSGTPLFFLFLTFPSPITSHRHGRFQSWNHFPISPMENRQLRTLLLQKIRPFQARNLELVRTSRNTSLYTITFISVLCCEWLCLNCYCICMCDVWCIVYYSQVHFHRTEQVPLHTHLSWAFSAFQGTAACSSLHPTGLQQLWPYPQVLHLPWSVPHCYSLVPFPL